MIVSVTVVSEVIPPLLASAVNVNGATAVTTGSEIAAVLLEVTVYGLFPPVMVKTTDVG